MAGSISPARRQVFGRRQAFAATAQARAARLPDDLKLFATTFAGGFLFMAIYLG